jgi:hypothetical protein
MSSIGYNEPSSDSMSIGSMVLGDNTYASNQLIGKEEHRDRIQTRQDDRVVSATHRTSTEPGMYFELMSMQYFLNCSIL